MRIKMKKNNNEDNSNINANASDSISNIFFQTITKPESDEETSSTIDNTQEETSSTLENTTEKISDNPETEIEAEFGGIETVVDDNSVNRNATSDNISDGINTIVNDSTIAVNNSSSNNSKESKPKKKLTFIPILIVCILLAVITGGIVYVLNNGKSDSKKSSLADRESLFSGLFNFSSPIDEVLGSKEITDTLYKSHGQLSASLKIDNCGNDENLSGVILDYAFNHNAKSKEISSNLNLSYRNAAIYSIQSFFNDSNIKFKIPSFAENTYVVNYDKFNKLYLNSMTDDSDLSYSELAQLLYAISSQSSNLFAGNSPQTGSCDIISIYIYAIEETYPDDYKKILSGITSEQSKDDSDGNKGITYTISEESIELFIAKLLSVSFDNKELSKQIPTLYTDDELKSIKQNLKLIGTIIPEFYSGEITFTIWKNASGLLTGFESSNEISFNDTPVSIDFAIDSYDHENPADSMTFTLSLLSGNNNYTMIYDRTKDMADSNTVTTHDITVSEDTSPILTMSVSEEFDSSNGEYSIIANANSDLTFSLMGTFVNISNGKSFDFVLDNFSIIDGYTNIMALSGNFSISTSKPDITEPSGSNVVISDLSDSEASAILDKIYEFLIKDIAD